MERDITRHDCAELAVAIHALLPDSARVSGLPWQNPQDSTRLAELIDTACAGAGLTEIQAAVIADGTAGYLSGWSGLIF